MPNYRTLGAITLMASVLWFSGPAAAETFSTEAKEIIMRPGFAIILQLPRAYKTAVVGDPLIADIEPRSDRVLTISARRLGTTNVIVLDGNGNEVYSALVIVGARDIGRVQVHSSARDVQAYTAFQCTQVSCVRVRDELAVGRPGGVRDPSVSYSTSTINADPNVPATPSMPIVPPPPQ